ncbi:GATA transcription factor 4-like [Silene latifolia]|uniref:GATA transcription factor 4-like n=1 Tax=Silene latifolia TaxID=37657 RepID=UPI003D77B4FA
MECMGVKALKSSFASEKAMKSVNQQVISDDIWCVTGDDFIIDDFFDIPNEENTNDDDNNNSNSNNKDDGFCLEEEQDEEEEEEKYSNSNSSNSLSSSHDLVDDSAHFSAHLAIPDDDMQELELWSQFMDDSVPEPSLPFPKSSLDAYFKKTGFTIVKPVQPCTKESVASVSRFPTAVPVKKRSKRPRATRNQSWFTGSHPKSPSSTLSFESTSLFARPVHEMGFCYTYGKPAMKKTRKEIMSVNGGIGAVQRKCNHCQVTKTPQWRAGPNGPKTLCNACGVRFKSGRLFPEYRPACSPTFSSEVHSNSHRKVLEMRHKREIVEAKSHAGST